jgi:hypothetical protein
MSLYLQVMSGRTASGGLTGLENRRCGYAPRRLRSISPTALCKIPAWQLPFMVESTTRVVLENGSSFDESLRSSTIGSGE